MISYTPTTGTQRTITHYPGNTLIDGIKCKLSDFKYQNFIVQLYCIKLLKVIYSLCIGKIQIVSSTVVVCYKGSNKSTPKQAGKLTNSKKRKRRPENCPSKNSS